MAAQDHQPSPIGPVRFLLFACETPDDATTLPSLQWPTSIKRLLFRKRTTSIALFAQVERAVECMNNATLAVRAAELEDPEHGIQQLFNFYMEQEADVTPKD